VSRLDRCYEALAGAAIYTSSSAAQERHLRATIEEYFMQAETQQQQGQGQQQQGGGDAAAAAAAGEGAAEGAAAEAQGGGNLMPWGAPCPIQRPSQQAVARQLRAVLMAAGARARDLGPCKFNGLALARMAAGLGSPAVPPSFWKGCKEWGRLAAVDFTLLAAAADQVVAEFWAAEQARPTR
jgi:hypothetical protein